MATIRSAKPPDSPRLDLTGSRVRHTNLSRANLEGAILDGADLSHAVLIGANLKDASLKGTILIGADLSGVKNLTVEQLREARTDGTTILPEGLRGYESSDS